MPELPEVETIRRSLEQRLPGRKILNVEIRKPKLLRGQDEVLFHRHLLHHTIRRVERRAKYLLLEIGEVRLLLHLGMTGQILLVPSQGRVRQCFPGLPDKHTHLRLGLSGGWTLYFRDPRMFGRFQVLSPQELEERFSGFGPEPLGAEFTSRYLQQALVGRKTSVKAQLLNQKILAGIGNIYADESLFLAGIAPQMPAAGLTRAQAERLHQAIRKVLKRAIQAGGTSISDFCDPENQPGRFQMQLKVYGRAGEKCRRCGRIIRKALVAQRGTHWCPGCQKGKKSRGKISGK